MLGWCVQEQKSHHPAPACHAFQPSVPSPDSPPPPLPGPHVWTLRGAGPPGSPRSPEGLHLPGHLAALLAEPAHVLGHLPHQLLRVQVLLLLLFGLLGLAGKHRAPGTLLGGSRGRALRPGSCRGSRQERAGQRRPRALFSKSGVRGGEDTRKPTSRRPQGAAPGLGQGGALTH